MSATYTPRTKTISYSDGSARPSTIAIHEDLHEERAGFFRAFWSDEFGNGCPIVGYCSAGGSFRTIRATVADARRREPGVDIYRNGCLVPEVNR